MGIQDLAPSTRWPFFSSFFRGKFVNFSVFGSGDALAWDSLALAGWECAQIFFLPKTFLPKILNRFGVVGRAPQNLFALLFLLAQKCVFCLFFGPEWWFVGPVTFFSPNSPTNLETEVWTDTTTIFYPLSTLLPPSFGPFTAQKGESANFEGAEKQLF